MSQGFVDRPPDDAAKGGAGLPVAGGFRSRLAISVAAMLFYGSFLCAVSAASWAAEHVVLRLVYGPVVVHWERLRFVKVKPGILVSNGDRLDNWGFPSFLIMTAIWVPLFWLLSVGAWRRLPADYRQRISGPSSDNLFATACPVDAVFLFLPLLLTATLIFSVGMGTAGVTLLALALGTAWLTAGQGPVAHTIPPAGGAGGGAVGAVGLHQRQDADSGDGAGGGRVEAGAAAGGGGAPGGQQPGGLADQRAGELSGGAAGGRSGVSDPAAAEETARCWGWVKSKNGPRQTTRPLLVGPVRAAGPPLAAGRTSEKGGYVRLLACCVRGGVPAPDGLVSGQIDGQNDKYRKGSGLFSQWRPIFVFGGGGRSRGGVCFSQTTRC